MTSMSQPLVRAIAIFATALAVNTATSLHGFAADASGWDGDTRASARLIAGSALGENDARIMRAGIEVRLAPGWKTYWRYPGDAGVPPTFDFTGSENAKTITVLWPAPQRFSTDGISYLGYKDHVILPLRIVPNDENKRVTVRLKLDYGICEKLCILAESKLELPVSGDATSHEVALAAAEARVAKPVEIGQGKALSIRTIRSEPGRVSPRIVVDVIAPTASHVDLFVEGPTMDWALPLPQPLVATGGGLHRFAFEMAGMPSGSNLRDVVLKFTAVADDQAIEVNTPLH